MIKQLNNKFFILILAITTIFKIFTAWNTDLFIDELIVLSRAYWDHLSFFQFSLYDSYHPPLTFLPVKIHYYLNQLTINKLRFTSIIVSLIPLIYFFKDINRNSLNKFLIVLVAFNAYIFSHSLLTTNYIFAYSLLLIFIHRYLQNKSMSSLLWLTGIIFFTNYLAGFVCILLLFCKSINDKELQKLYKYLYLNIPFILSILMFFILQYYYKPFELFSQVFLIISSVIYLKDKVAFIDIIKLTGLFYLIHLVETYSFESSISVDFNSVMVLSQILLILFFALRTQEMKIHKLAIIAVIQYIIFYFNHIGMDYYILLSGAYFYSMLFLFKREFFKAKYIPVQLIIFWLTQKTMYNITVYNTVNDFYNSAPAHSPSAIKFSPYVILGLFILISIILIKDRIKKYFSESPNYVFLVLSILIFCLTIIGIQLTGRTVYMRYYFFLTAIMIFLAAFLASKIKNRKSLTTLFSIYIFSNLLFTPSQLTYFDTMQTSSIYKKITSHGKYSNEIYFFTRNYAWHKYYFKDYKIKENFVLYTLKKCDNETIDKVLTMAGRNSFIVAYDFECPSLTEKILKNCSKYNSKCFDLNAEHATAILKMFEPETQPQKIKELEETYQN